MEEILIPVLGEYRFETKNIKKEDLAFSNFNTTVERLIQTGWSGLRCTEISLLRKSLKKITFSIKIESCLYFNIFFGFFVKTEDATGADKGYYTTKFSFMLNLNDGKFYSRSSSSNYIETDLKGPAKNKQIFSASLDINKKTVRFYLDGKPLRDAKEIDLKPEEAELMCPCVDLGSQGDIVSLVVQEIE